MQLDRYEALLGESDHGPAGLDLRPAPVPEQHDHDVFRLLQGFRLLEPAD